ncbi:MAG: SLC13 family permease [Desulfobacterales bacterium]
MSTEILLVFIILAVAVLLLVTEWVAMEVTALLVLVSVTLTGLINPREALAGFSNPAVITVWAVFILSGGLTRTGVANIIGQWVLKVAGRGEGAIIAVVMLSAGVMSAVMNNVAVAALMLPVVMDIARQTGHPASRLMMPLAYGSLLGGLTTQIGTPPNLLVSDILRENGLTAFRLFDFAPVGVVVMGVGIAFMVLVGRHLLPRTNISEGAALGGGMDLSAQYHLPERMFTIKIPASVHLVGQTLKESRIGAILGVNVLGITRQDRTILAPGPHEVLQAEDLLAVEGDLNRIQALKQELGYWRTLTVGGDDDLCHRLFADEMPALELVLSEDASFVGRSLREIGLPALVGATILAVRRGERIHRTALQDLPLKAGDILLAQAPPAALESLKATAGVADVAPVSLARLREVYRLRERLLVVAVPEQSMLNGRTLKGSRLGAALGVRVLAIQRQGNTQRLPAPEERIAGGDTLVVEGSAATLALLRSLADLDFSSQAPSTLDHLQGAGVGLMEAILSPHAKIAGKTLAELHFREKYGLNVLGVWREGHIHRSGFLRDMALRFGDAMLLYGPRAKFSILGQEPDFIVLTQSHQEVPNYAKAKIALAVLVGIIVPVLLGLMPIYIATLLGAALMVITGCLTMEEAHRAVEWKGIILIAGMLPLGTALDSSGAARLLADGVVNWVGPWGPYAVLTGLMLLTFAATCIIPTAALVVLLGPIVLNTAGDLSIAPHALLMAVAVAASASFMTPISHPANILVMGPGGYRFGDYLKVGVPLTLVVLVVVLLVLPWVWPL